MRYYGYYDRKGKWVADTTDKEVPTTFLYIKRLLRHTNLATLYEVEMPPEGNWLDKEPRQVWIPDALVINNYYEADKSIEIPIWFYNQLVDEGKL